MTGRLKSIAYSMRVARKTGAVSGTRTWEFEEVPLGSLLLPEKM